MNVKFSYKMTYENEHDWTLGQNKPKTNPKQTQFKPCPERSRMGQSKPVLSAVEWANFRKTQMNVNSLITKDYERNDIFAVPENKANSNFALSAVEWANFTTLYLARKLFGFPDKVSATKCRK